MTDHDPHEQAVLDGFWLYQTSTINPGDLFPVSLLGWCYDAAMREGRNLPSGFDMDAAVRAAQRLVKAGLLLNSDSGESWRLSDVVHGLKSEDVST